ncbi:MAG: MFS transporter [Planctomycetes bacterium]|nr:MFS transporter [Planctomycetota bacterium]
MTQNSPRAVSQIKWPRAIGWALYDFANTIYSAVVVSFAIALHVKEFTGVEKYTFLTAATSMGLGGLVMPFIGEYADRTGGSKHLLFFFTALCCAACSAITGAYQAWMILVLYFLANFAYNACFPLYDSLLPLVSPPSRRGLISGLGVGIGYAGVAFSLPIAMFVTHLYRPIAPSHPLTPLFTLAGVLFLLFSLPLFILVPERPANPPIPKPVAVLKTAYKRTVATILRLPRRKSIFLFLIGNFLCVDALNATIIGYAPYVKHVLGLSLQTVMFWMIPFAISALIMGIIGGRLSDRYGSRPIFLSAGVAFIIAVAVCGLSSSPWTFYPAFLIFGGYGLSTVWVAGRRMLLSLAPEGQIGKYFGLYNVGHKLSMIGMIFFGVLADIPFGGSPTGGYRVALLVQILTMGIGMVFVWKVNIHDSSRK